MRESLLVASQSIDTGHKGTSSKTYKYVQARKNMGSTVYYGIIRGPMVQGAGGNKMYFPFRDTPAGAASLVADYMNEQLKQVQAKKRQRENQDATTDTVEKFVRRGRTLTVRLTTRNQVRRAATKGPKAGEYGNGIIQRTPDIILDTRLNDTGTKSTHRCDECEEELHGPYQASHRVIV